jgi:hypothetical protein
MLGQACSQVSFYVRGGFVEHPSLALAVQASATKIISPTLFNLGRAKHELFLNKPASVFGQIFKAHLHVRFQRPVSH